MADITMCDGQDCPLKENCYRHTAPVNEYRQSMFVNTPYNKEKNKCEEFWDNKNYKQNGNKRRNTQ